MLKGIPEILSPQLLKVLCEMGHSDRIVIADGNFPVESMGKDFYENFYYEQVGSTDEERADFLSKYESIGIKINLDNLSRYGENKNADEISKFVNQKTKKACDKTNTKVVIYPQKPYNKTSYKIETQLDCGFDETNTK